MEKKYWKIQENFVSPEKMEPWYFMNTTQIYSDKL